MSGHIKIDLESVLREKLGKKSRWIPRGIVRRLERLIHQDDMNTMLEKAYPRRGSKFCDAVLEHLDISLNVVGMENMPPKAHRKVIFCSNHPLGGLDGMSLIKFVAEYYETEPLFIINDLLMAIEPLRDVFVPVNKHGRQSREAIVAIDEAMSGDRPVIIFPAGLCSRRRGGEIKDLQWQKMFVQKALQWGRDIVPMRFIGKNSDNFYRWARRRERMGLKFNAEMVLLPGEVFKSRGKSFTIAVAPPVRVGDLSKDTRAETQRIREIVDSMEKLNK